MRRRTLQLARILLPIVAAGIALSGLTRLLGVSDPLAPLGMPPGLVQRSVVAVVHAAKPSSKPSKPSAQAAAGPQSSGPATQPNGSGGQRGSPAKTAPSSRHTPTTSSGTGGNRSHKPKSGGAKTASDLQFVPVAEPTCHACRVVQDENGSIGATIAGSGANETAYALLDFGGPQGLDGQVVLRDEIGLGAGQSPAADLQVLRVLDIGNRVVYGLSVSAHGRVLHLTSPPGGLNADPLDIDTGIVVPNDGSRLPIVVSLDPDGVLVLKAANKQITKRTGSRLGSTAGRLRYLAAGIVGVDSGAEAAMRAGGPLSVTHAGVSVVSGSPGSLPAPSSPPPLAPQPAAPALAAIVTDPTVSANVSEGAKTSADLGVWSDKDAVLKVQWERCTADGADCTAIDGATDPTYVPRKADVGFTLRVRVTATNDGGTATAFSSASDAVRSGVPVLVQAPALTGETVVGKTLSGQSGTWDNAVSFAYGWQRCGTGGDNCTSIPGADQQTLQLALADLGATIRFVVTATGTADSVSAASDPSPVVTIPLPVNVNAPSISGDTVVGSTLQASKGEWDALMAQFSFAWQRCDSGGTCSDIDGATNDSFVLTTADLGSTIQVKVTATNPAGSVSATSAPTGVVTDIPMPPPAQSDNTVTPPDTGTGGDDNGNGGGNSGGGDNTGGGDTGGGDDTGGGGGHHHVPASQPAPHSDDSDQH